MFKKSLYFRNFVTTAGIVLFSFLILGIVFSFWSYRLVIREKRDTMSTTANEVVRSVSAYSQEWDIDGFEMRMALSMLSSSSGFDILVTNISGVVVSSSERQVVSMYIGKVVPSDVLAVIGSGRSYGANTNLGGIFGGMRYVVGVPLTQGRGAPIQGYVFLSTDPSSMSGIWHQFAGIFLLTAAIVLCLTFITSYITTKKQAEPINEIALAAHRFARGDFSARVDNRGSIDEIGQLADAFNTMADSIEHSEQMRREFIANVSHELKTPMTVISGFADGILDGTIPREAQNKYLAVISSETMRLSRLVRGMLDMSQLQSKPASELLKGTFDIAEVIRVSLLSLEGKIESRNLDVEAELPEEPVMTRGDSDSITQVVYNLIDNAIKFAESGSAIRLSLWKQGRKAFVSVENRGGTIPEEDMPYIFERFHKADKSRSENREGAGLGLYIVKSILDNHNEDIFVTSREGVTKFVFSLTTAGQVSTDGGRLNAPSQKRAHEHGNESSDTQ